MKNWRNDILDKFVPNVSKLTLAEDPDGLLTEEKMAVELRSRGFDLLEFNDPIEFRYAYESQYRSIWDKGEKTNLVVILRLKKDAMTELPYDLLQAGKQLSFNLGEIFPNISYAVLDKLDRSLLDSLFQAQISSPTDIMGDNASKDYILRHVFSIAHEMINDEIQLLRCLLKLHYGTQNLPDILSAHLIKELKRKQVFSNWSLEYIIPDAQAFFAFLQERWPLFIKNTDNKYEVREASEPYGLKYKGPNDLPFGHEDIKVYIDNLFLEGKLNPIESNKIAIGDENWVKVGIVKHSIDHHEEQIARQFKTVENLPTPEDRYSEWVDFAQKWAELCSAVHRSKNTEHKAKLKEIGRDINRHFEGWLKENYAGLVTLPVTNPAMLHHIPRHVAHNIKDIDKSRIAIVVMDGLALDQWVTIRETLKSQKSGIIFRESAVFAWVPTLTSVSRQAIFAAAPPLYFPTSIHSTHKEEKLWGKFWQEKGFSPTDIVYQKGLGDGDAHSKVTDISDSGAAKIIGLVVDKVDEIMHGMQLGAAGMHNQVQQWCEGNFLFSLIDSLLEFGYDVWMTADHGNIECHGRGKASEGVIAEIRGERARVYSDERFRSRIAESFDFAHCWEPIGLPKDYFPLVAGNDDAFVADGETIVGHGGIAIEEVIVPFVKFERAV